MYKTILRILIVALIPALSGCATTRATLPPQAKRGLTQIDSALANGRAQLQSAVGVLRTLDRPGTDIPSAVKAYSQQVTLLNQTVESTREQLKDADRPDEFFSSWKADLDQIRDTELRETGEKRYAAARHELERLNQEVDRLRDVFRPFHTDLNDVETYLRNDPTTAGVEAVRSKIRKIIGDEKPVLARADEVEKAIRQLLR